MCLSNLLGYQQALSEKNIHRTWTWGSPNYENYNDIYYILNNREDMQKVSKCIKTSA